MTEESSKKILKDFLAKNNEMPPTYTVSKVGASMTKWVASVEFECGTSRNESVGHWGKTVEQAEENAARAALNFATAFNSLKS